MVALLKPDYGTVKVLCVEPEMLPKELQLNHEQLGTGCILPTSVLSHYMKSSLAMKIDTSMTEKDLSLKPTTCHE